jgi:plastocyanin
VLAAVVLVLSGTPAAAVPELVVTTTAGFQYAPPTVVVPAGASLRLVQLDPLARHDVVSRIVSRGRPLFGNERTLSFGETAIVAGVERLRPATYPFTCSIHSQMSGTLIVR